MNLDCLVAFDVYLQCRSDFAGCPTCQFMGEPSQVSIPLLSAFCPDWQQWLHCFCL